MGQKAQRKTSIWDQHVEEQISRQIILRQNFTCILLIIFRTRPVSIWGFVIGLPWSSLAAIYHGAEYKPNLPSDLNIVGSNMNEIPLVKIRDRHLPARPDVLPILNGVASAFSTKRQTSLQREAEEREDPAQEHCPTK